MCQPLVGIFNSFVKVVVINTILASSLPLLGGKPQLEAQISWEISAWRSSAPEASADLHHLRQNAALQRERQLGATSQEWSHFIVGKSMNQWFREWLIHVDSAMLKICSRLSVLINGLSTVHHWTLIVSWFWWEGFLPSGLHQTQRVLFIPHKWNTRGEAKVNLHTLQRSDVYVHVYAHVHVKVHSNVDMMHKFSYSELTDAYIWLFWVH